MSFSHHPGRRRPARSPEWAPGRRVWYCSETGRRQQDHRDCSGEKRRQGQDRVKQQDDTEKSNGGGEEQEAPQRGRREAGFQKCIHLHRADDQVEGQGNLAGGESQSSAAQQQNR